MTSANDSSTPMMTPVDRPEHQHAEKRAGEDIELLPVGAEEPVCDVKLRRAHERGDDDRREHRDGEVLDEPVPSSSMHDMTAAAMSETACVRRRTARSSTSARRSRSPGSSRQGMRQVAE